MPDNLKKITPKAKRANTKIEFAFSLYITGASPNSARAIKNIVELLQAQIPEKYSLDVVDVYQQPEISEHVNIIALPMLIRTFPGPERRLIGDLSDREKIIARLELPKISK